MSRFSMHFGILEGDSDISEKVGNIKQVQTLINELGLGGDIQANSLLNKNAIINLRINQSECRKYLRSASSRIGSV